MDGCMQTEVVTQPEELWNVRQVATYLKVSTCWVYRKAESGLLPFKRVGRGLRFRPSDIAAWFAAQPGGGAHGVDRPVPGHYPRM